MDSLRGRGMTLLICTGSLVNAMPMGCSQSPRATSPTNASRWSALRDLKSHSGSSSSSATNISKRADGKQLTAAIIGVIAGAGVLILVLLFLALYIVVRGRPRLLSKSRHSRKTKDTNQLYRHRELNRRPKGHEKRPRRSKQTLQEPDRDDSQAQTALMPASEYQQHAQQGSMVEHMPPGLDQQPHLQLPAPPQTFHYSSLPAHNVELPSASTYISTPESIRARGIVAHRPPVGRWRPPIPLPPLNTHPAELVGSDESRYPVIPGFQRVSMQDSWYQPSSPTATTTSLSTFGLDTSRALMDELPTPISPTGGGVKISHVSISSVGDEPWNTPLSHRRSGSYEVGNSGELSPLSAGLWTIQEQREIATEGYHDHLRSVTAH